MSMKRGSDHAGCTGLWTQVSGIGITTFVTSGSPTSVVNGSLYGTYVLRWTETNGSCAPRTYDVTIDFNEDPTWSKCRTGQNLCGSTYHNIYRDRTSIPGWKRAYRFDPDLELCERTG